jgi:hypothetical protein
MSQTSRTIYSLRLAHVFNELKFLLKFISYGSWTKFTSQLSNWASNYWRVGSSHCQSYLKLNFFYGFSFSKSIFTQLSDSTQFFMLDWVDLAGHIGFVKSMYTLTMKSPHTTHNKSILTVDIIFIILS